MGKPQYKLIELPPPELYEYDQTAAYGINEDSVVVGTAGGLHQRTGSTSGHAVMWKDLGLPQAIGDGSTVNVAEAVNANEQAVGHFTAFPDPSTHAFLYSGGPVQDLASVLGAASASAEDINDGGVVVGSTTGTGSTETQAFIWDSKGSAAPVLLAPSSWAAGINTAGTVAGIQQSHGFILRNGQLQDLGQSTLPLGLSKTNEWVTGWKGPGRISLVKGFRVDASLAPLAFEEVGPTGMWSIGTAINANGVTIGYAGVAGGEQSLVFVDFPPSSPFAGSHNLADVVTNGAGWEEFTRAEGINNKGEIVGFGLLQGRTRAFLLRPLDAVFEEALSKLKLAFMMLIGGVESGGGGTGITFGKKPIPIDPLGPFSTLWKDAFRRNPDMLVGWLVGKLASLSDNQKTRELLDRTAREILRDFGQSKKLG